MFIGPDGLIKTVGTPEVSIGKVTSKRASRIVPVNLVKRIAFKVIRLCVSDTSRVAAWTRTWSGGWICTILSSGETFCNSSRSKCIEWEIERLEDALTQEG